MKCDKFQKNCCFRFSLKPEGKTIKFDFIVDLEIFTLSLVTFFDSNQMTLKTFLGDTIDGV